MKTLRSALFTIPHLTIRQKVLAGAIIPAIIFTVAGVISFTYLVRLESALSLTEMADDLSNTILEVRRYEKNYLLYGHEEDFHEAQEYLAQGQRRPGDDHRRRQRPARPSGHGQPRQGP